MTPPARTSEGTSRADTALGGAHRVALAYLNRGDLLVATTENARTEIAARAGQPWVLVRFDSFLRRVTFARSLPALTAHDAQMDLLLGKAAASAGEELYARRRSGVARLVFEQRDTYTGPAWFATSQYERDAPSGDSSTLEGS